MLLDKVKTNILDPLGAAGWSALLARHGLDITVPIGKLEEELSRTLRVDRTVPGFEDFTTGGCRAVEAGDPAASLLYHALASPGCRPDPVAGKDSVFPTLEQLDLLENFIYSRARRTLADFRDPVLAVFAFQYRPAGRTTHRQHADMVYSRTGVARVGTHAAQYDGATRAFAPNPGAGAKGFCVMPARYALYIAERRTRGADGAVLRPSGLDPELTFLFPVHKVFAGDECLFTRGADDKLQPLQIAQVKFAEIHVNEKLARVHDHQHGENDGYVPLPASPAFDIAKHPFVRHSDTDKNMVSLVDVGASCQVVPVAGPLVSLVHQQVNGKGELVRFKVPPPKEIRGRSNRYWSTLELTAKGNSRAAPEYLNIRQEVIATDPPELADLNRLPTDEFDKKVLQHGGYEAAHFADHTCDGAIAAYSVTGIDLPSYCAFSLVSAVDYFPLVDQVEVEEWVEKKQLMPTGLANTSLMFPQGGPQPMSDGRFQLDDEKSVQGTTLTYQIPNCQLPHPITHVRKAISIEESSIYTATAIVGTPSRGAALGMGASASSVSAKKALSWLPDAAADVYAPGWDVSQHQTNGRNMMVSYGLGSPFPEDAKLCAALNSFWPAVAPDSGRTYGFRPPKPGQPLRNLFTSLPLTDAELGYHAKHPMVVAKEAAEQTGWDGDYGPYIDGDTSGRFVYAANALRADLTRAAYDMKLHYAGLDLVSTREFILRLNALVWLRDLCDEWCRFTTGRVLNHRQSGWWLITFQKAQTWAGWTSEVFPALSAAQKGSGYVLVFATVGPGEEFEAPPLRLRYPLRDTIELHISNAEVLAPEGDGDGATVFARHNGGKVFEITKALKWNEVSS
jgi:hypothetical protein